MFVRVKRSVGANGEAHGCLQIVRSVRDGEHVRQKVVGTLGRRDELVATGQLDGLLRGIATFRQKLSVVEN